MADDARALDSRSLEPIDMSQLTLADIDAIPNEVLRGAVESVLRDQGPDALTHNSHRSHHNRA
jgi:hypothetical protein